MVKIRGIEKVIPDYLEKSSWRIKENSSFTYSLGGLDAQLSGYESSRYWLDEVYSNEIANAHRTADIHIHDLGMLASYCNGWSLRQLITDGLGGLKNRVSSGPAKHMTTLVVQIVNFLGIMANESAGAQALSSLDTYLAPFVREDNLDYDGVKQAMQMLVFGLNVESRWSGQPPFSNVTFDWEVPDDMKDTPCYFGGGVLDYTYSELQSEMDMINKAFIEVMTEGDANGRAFAYPIPTYNITEDFHWDSENADLLFEMTGKYGVPYFQNFISSDLDPSAVRSMCCRLQLDLNELTKRGGGLFGANEFTGSIGVVTINMPRLAYRVRNSDNKEEDFFKFLDSLMDIARDSLEVKREKLYEFKDAGLFPYTDKYLYMGWKNHFSTIGLCGMNEACLNLFDKDLTDEDSIDFTVKVLEYMRNRLIQYQQETGNLYNLEASPAEGTSYRFAKHDMDRGLQHYYSGKEDAPFYTNSTHLPVGATESFVNALEMQEKIQSEYTGGTVFHGYMGQSLPGWATKHVIKTTFENYRIPYLSITPTYSVCEEHGYIAGEHYTCPTCGKESEVYSRVTGYYRPVEKFNIGKRQEFKERKTYNVGE